MIIHDISMTVEESIPVYKDNPAKKPVFRITRNFPEAPARETTLSIDMHTGTHLDTPLHFIPDGYTVEKLDVDRLITPCRVLDLTEVKEAIHADDLKKFEIKPQETILFKTRNSWDEVFNYDFVYLARDGAAYLKDIAINCVGTDSLGIERAQTDYATHRTLLGADIIIIEGLRLKDIKEGSYFLLAAPIKIAGVEAAPVRALLLEDFQR